jgi:hypothetical protein
MFETFANDFYSAAPKQSAKPYEGSTVSMCSGMSHILNLWGFPKYLGCRELITKLLKIVEPLAVEARKRRRFKRK